ncbi:13434_t:CDS:10 [Entrophospora sp. SA101]|nr:13434_t:CDS:10 [Entrophospora sp. SA101]
MKDLRNEFQQWAITIEEEIARLKNELKTAKNVYFGEQLVKAQEIIKAKEIEIIELQNSLNQEQIAHNRTFEELANTTEGFQILAEKKDNLQEQHQQDIAQKQQKITELNSEIYAVQAQLDSAEAELEQARDNFSTEQDTHQATQAELLRKNQDLSEIERKRNELQIQLNSLQAEKETLLENLANTLINLNNLNKQNKKLLLSQSSLDNPQSRINYFQQSANILLNKSKEAFKQVSRLNIKRAGRVLGSAAFLALSHYGTYRHGLNSVNLLSNPVNNSCECSRLSNDFSQSQIDNQNAEKEDKIIVELENSEIAGIKQKELVVHGSSLEKFYSEISDKDKQNKKLKKQKNNLLKNRDSNEKKLKIKFFKEKTQNKQLNAELEETKRNLTAANDQIQGLNKKKITLTSERDSRPNITVDEYNNLVNNLNSIQPQLIQSQQEEREFQTKFLNEQAEHNKTKIELAKIKYNNSQREVNSYQDYLQNVLGLIATDLNSLPTNLPIGQTLFSLINFYQSIPQDWSEQIENRPAKNVYEELEIEATSQLQTANNEIINLKEKNKTKIEQENNKKLKSDNQVAYRKIKRLEKDIENLKKEQQIIKLKNEISELEQRPNITVHFQLATETDAKTKQENKLTAEQISHQTTHKKLTTEIRLNQEQTGIINSLVDRLAKRDKDLALIRKENRQLKTRPTQEQLNEAVQNAQAEEKFDLDLAKVSAERDNRPNITEIEFKGLQKKIKQLEADNKTIERKYNDERINHNSTQTQLTNEQNIISNAKNHLQVDDLENLPEMNGQSLRKTLEKAQSATDYKNKWNNVTQENKKLNQKYRQVLIDQEQEKQNSEQEKTNYQTIIQNLEIAKNKKESEATHLSSLLAKIEKEHNQELLNQNREWKEKLEKGRTQNGFFTITISGISYLVGKGISRQKLQEKYGKGINKIEQLIDKLTNDYQTAQTQLNEANTKRQKAEQERDRYQQDYQNEKTRANNLQTQLDSHICSAPPTCSHTDYEQIKNEQDNYKSQLEQQEKELTQKLNTDLNLNLKNEPKLEQVITRLQELLRQPSFPPKNMSGENLEMVKQIDLRMLQNAFSQMTRTETQAIEQTISYQQLATVRNEIIRKYLTNNTQTISPPKGQLIKPENRYYPRYGDNDLSERAQDLEELNLSNNFLTSVIFKEMRRHNSLSTTSTQQLPKLKVLNLRNNNLSPKSLMQFSELKNLEELDVSMGEKIVDPRDGSEVHNKLTGGLFGVKDLLNLKKLTVRNTDVSIQDIEILRCKPEIYSKGGAGIRDKDGNKKIFKSDEIYQKMLEVCQKNGLSFSDEKISDEDRKTVQNQFYKRIQGDLAASQIAITELAPEFRLLADITRVFNQKKLQAIENIKQQLKSSGVYTNKEIDDYINNSVHSLTIATISSQYHDYERMPYTTLEKAKPQIIEEIKFKRAEKELIMALKAAEICQDNYIQKAEDLVLTDKDPFQNFPTEIKNYKSKAEIEKQEQAAYQHILGKFKAKVQQDLGPEQQTNEYQALNQATTFDLVKTVRGNIMAARRKSSPTNPLNPDNQGSEKKPLIPLPPLPEKGEKSGLKVTDDAPKPGAKPSELNKGNDNKDKKEQSKPKAQSNKIPLPVIVFLALTPVILISVVVIIRIRMKKRKIRKQ